MTAATPSPQLARLSRASRLRIEQAVLETFSEQEFHKVSLIDIARGASVSLQTIYKYYGGKEALLFGTLDTQLGALAVRMIDHLQGIETFEDRLRKVLWVIFDYFEGHPRVAQLLMSSVYLNTWSQTDTFRQPELFAIFMQVLREGRSKGILTDEVDEKVLLDILIGVASRTITMWILRGQPAGLAEQSQVLFRLLWRAITPAAAGHGTVDAKPALA